jgi:hypothetical protein
VTLEGLVFEDGIVTVAIAVDVPDGWDGRRPDLELVFGPEGRDAVAAAIRAVVLPAVTGLVHELDGHDRAVVQCEYFNLTYVGATSLELPGRAVLSEEHRGLLYPESPEPLRSMSPRAEELLYAGFAYSVLAEADGSATTRAKLVPLLLILGYQYARLTRGIALAEQRLDLARADAAVDQVGGLELLELVITSDFRELSAPTFSFDHHALKLRDAYLEAWNVQRVFDRCRFTLTALHQHEQRRLAAQQSERVKRLDAILLVIAALSLVGTLEAGYNLVEKLP